MLGYGEAQVSIPEFLLLIQSVNEGIGIITQTETGCLFECFFCLVSLSLIP